MIGAVVTLGVFLLGVAFSSGILWQKSAYADSLIAQTARRVEQLGDTQKEIVRNLAAITQIVGKLHPEAIVPQ